MAYLATLLPEVRGLVLDKLSLAEGWRYAKTCRVLFRETAAARRLPAQHIPRQWLDVIRCNIDEPDSLSLFIQWALAHCVTMGKLSRNAPAPRWPRFHGFVIDIHISELVSFRCMHKGGEPTIVALATGIIPEADWFSWHTLPGNRNVRLVRDNEPMGDPFDDAIVLSKDEWIAYMARAGRFDCQHCLEPDPEAAGPTLL